MDENKRVWRAAAVEQALQIQKQKQIRDRVYDTIIDLIDLPHDASSDPGIPSSSDLQQFQDGVSLFSPEDFDQVALERNIYEKCGYPLCNKQVDLSLRKGTHAILWAKKGVDLDVVPQREIPRWCSPRCEKYANLIKKQLLNEPAWERRGSSKKIQIPLSANDTVPGDLTKREVLASGTSKNSQDLTDKMEALSIERTGRQQTEKQINFRLVEKSIDNASVVPPQGGKNDPGTIEGYAPHAKLYDTADGDGNNDGRDDFVDLLSEKYVPSAN